MAHIRTFAGFLALGASLGACDGVNQGLSPHWNPSISSVNQPVVERSDFVFDISSSGGGVPAGELDRLDAWFESLALGYGDRVAIDSGYSDPAVRADIARVAASYGLLLADGAPVTAGAVPPGAARVVVSRSTATVPGCPIWDDVNYGARISTAPNYGCATNSNLAAMIADPNDLVLGQAGSSATDPALSNKAIGAYRQRALSGASGAVKQESTGGQ